MSELEIGELKTVHASLVEALRKMRRDVPAGDTASKQHNEKTKEIEAEVHKLERQIRQSERDKGRNVESEAVKEGEKK